MVIIRKATIKDASEIAKIQVEGWQTTYKSIIPRQYLDTLSHESKTKNGRKSSIPVIIYLSSLVAIMNHVILRARRWLLNIQNVGLGQGKRYYKLNERQSLLQQNQSESVSIFLYKYIYRQLHKYRAD